MYTIQIGEKFLKFAKWISNQVDDAKVTAVPQIVYSKREATDLLRMGMIYMRRMVEHNVRQVKRFESTIATKTAELAKIRNTMAVNGRRPYNLVRKEMGKLERRELILTQEIERHTEWKRYAERQLTRWNKLIAGNPQVVKLQKASIRSV
jgi:hypothetical protein